MRFGIQLLIVAIVVSPIATSAALPSPAEVLKQNGAGFPTTWGTNAGKLVPAYYEMAKSIVEDNSINDELAKGLRGLPSLAVTLTIDDLFGPEKGIYSNPLQTG